jgi:hypothetical protein
MFFNILNKLESRKVFFSKIENYYKDLSNGEIPINLLEKMIVNVTYDKYQFYKECWRKYPKSKKRYSSFQIKDLEHPYIYFYIINFFEDKKVSYNLSKKYCKILFKMNEIEFKRIEKDKEFYDTK